ncbi:hypothetical protein IFM58399_06219 [Aspergillus lentulus]|uniref:BTB domain-containing protein n=1 Tax=Aspergillus lentulus TaxID=293939 RepID=A0AAN5YSK8_ASPLE|nr:uncharacterized protein IFM58399_06219 [Aspergillus lentulus]KAF4160527.1 hypothetical protein CNMCM6069_008139 [Aspergillus lentulus]KAF4167965.1 hypothetical protein CNMCM6936_003840 [Aspergillus lentulus]KAF4182638.1 hypothetical protein CNMCM7927_009576 [Aspergillus lentulus]KAF4182763.1 hypothetical protein CNMCM8060_006127 [Aspergillus lentulus]KAF4196047.1 hypothetical protein CNMCM8694_005476 [Aspergillus lentulus]
MNPEVNRASDPDPNGDVVLVVSPPKQPRAYAPSRVYSDGEAGLVRYRASSKHLSLASQYFEKRLKKEWGEGEELQKIGSVAMLLPNTDPEAFSILLDLMHCRTQEVPTVVTFDELVELAVQVNYFKCHGALGLYPARWIEHLKAKRPNAYCDEIIKWIFVSGVFNDCELYASVTCLAIRQSKDIINTLDLPIPLSVTGTLMKQMKAHGLPWPRENLDYKGLAPESVAKKILEFEKPSSKVTCKASLLGRDSIKMSGTCYEIDPSGDIVLVLSAQRRASPKTSPAEGTTQARPVESTSPTSTNADTDTPIQKDAEETPPNSEETALSAVETPRTQFKVSSKHLTLASNYFNKHLKKRISATSTADPPEKVHILDCYPEALLIVMNIIHNKGQQIPKEVDATMLQKVAAVVRYLDCLEACTFFFRVWIQRLVNEDKIVFDTWDNCLKWVYISWASNRYSLFTSSTSAAMSWRCSSSTYPADLNLPERIKGIVVTVLPHPLLAPAIFGSRSNTFYGHRC